MAPDVIRGAPTRSTVFLDFNNDGDLDYLTSAVSGSTAATAVTVPSHLGTLPITNSTTDNHYITWQVDQSFYFIAGERFSFGGRMQFNEATDIDIFFGAISTGDTDPIGGITGGGIYVLKADDAATLAIAKCISNSSTTLNANIDTVAASTYYEWAFEVHVTGEAKADIAFFIDGALAYYGEDVTICASTEQLRITLTVQNGAAASKTATVDTLWWDVPLTR